jgi:hypothetical protein
MNHTKDHQPVYINSKDQLHTIFSTNKAQQTEINYSIKSKVTLNPKYSKFFYLKVSVTFSLLYVKQKLEVLFKEKEKTKHKKIKVLLFFDQKASNPATF